MLLLDYNLPICYIDQTWFIISVLQLSGKVFASSVAFTHSNLSYEAGNIHFWLGFTSRQNHKRYMATYQLYWWSAPPCIISARANTLVEPPTFRTQGQQYVKRVTTNTTSI